MAISLGILAAIGCACASNLAFLCKHRGARRCPPVVWQRPLASATALWRSPWFAAGMALAAMAWAMHVLAMTLAPLSVVQAVIAGGIVLVGVTAERLFGVPVSPRQRWGLALTATGLVLLGLTLPSPAADHDAFSAAAMIAFEAGLFGVGALLVVSPGLGGTMAHRGMLLGTAAGMLFGVSNVAVKALTEIIGHDGAVAALLVPWAPLALTASVVAFYASARSLQEHDAVAVIAVTGTAANIAGIAGGILVFGDPLPGDALGIAAQATAFVLIVVAAALTPGPLRAAEGRAA